MASNLESTRVKHIDVKHHFIRDAVTKVLIKIEHIGTRNQLADLFTKSLDINTFNRFHKSLGLHD